jgi:hypothetical protein
MTIKNPTYLSSILLSFWNRSVGSDIELDGQVYNFIRFILENMGEPYVTTGIGIYPSQILTLNVCGTKHEYYADLCLYPNYIVSHIISLLITFELFAALNYPRWDKYESKFDLKQMRKRPLDTWPRDDAEAKLIANAIAAYDFNNYEAPKLYHDLDEEDKEDVDPYFMVRDPISLAGMTWMLELASRHEAHGGGCVRIHSLVPIRLWYPPRERSEFFRKLVAARLVQFVSGTSHRSHSCLF